MDQAYFKRQTANKPLFDELLWARPENRQHAGKLLVIGGNAQAVQAPAQAYGLAERAGIGTARVLLPDALRKSIGRVLEAGEYAASTPSGSFAVKALDEFLAMAGWADGVLFAGDLGRNSETAILMEKFLEKFSGQVTLTRDSAVYITQQPALVLDRPNTLLVLSYSQLQKLATAIRFPNAFSFDITLSRLVDNLHALTAQYPLAIITRHLEQTFVAFNGEVCATAAAATEADELVWRLPTATAAAVWWLQNPTKTFEALVTSLVDTN